MLYLEDYLESIEHLPQEVWDKFTEMRDLDLQAQLTKDGQRKKLKDFFARAPTMARPDRDREFRSIRAGYDEALSCAGMKTQIAQTMYDTVDRYLRKLDAEIQKLKMELEADSPGITEVLEQRALESETRDGRDVKTTRAGDRKILSDGLGAAVDGVPGQIYGLGQIMGASGTALAAAASQAIAATQQMQQGRRSASLKASFDAISGVHDLAVDGGAAVAGTSHDAGRKKSSKKQRAPSITKEPPSSPSAPSAALGATLLGVDGVLPDWAVDPNEPRYCICNQVSYGDMVACDNEECPYEWFHYACVGMTEAPKGKWYCPRCTASMKRRGTRK